MPIIIVSNIMAKPSLAETIRDYNKPTPRDFVMAAGGTGRAAAALAGVPYEKGVSKKPEYKAAMRNVQRYLKGQRTPSAETQTKIEAITGPVRPTRDVGITFDGTIAVNGRGPAYERDRTIDRLFSPADWDELTRMAEDDDEEGLWDYMANDYGVNYLELMDGEILIGED